MCFKEINLRSVTPDGAVTEIMYEIATCRADGVELIRFNISLSNSFDNMEVRKILPNVIRTLKNMKQKRSIQFIATPESFENKSTESRFLSNKYPHLFESIPVVKEDESFIFVKL